MSYGAGPSQIHMFAEVACFGCGKKRREAATYVAAAARLLRKAGWRYIERDGGWGWCCANCVIDKMTAEALRLREAVRP